MTDVVFNKEYFQNLFGAIRYSCEESADGYLHTIKFDAWTVFITEGDNDVEDTIVSMYKGDIKYPSYAHILKDKVIQYIMNKIK